MRQIISPLDGIRSPFGARYGFSPATLFALAEPGVWYDPSDFSTLFQDAAGTTPVTAVEQSVGLVLDKSKGLVLGSELVTNGTFDSDTAWTKGSGWTIGSGAASRTAVGAQSFLEQAGTVENGKFYRVSFTVTAIISGDVGIRLGSNAVASSVTVSTTGTFTVIAQCTTAGGVVAVRASSGFSGTIDNISVKELPGFHATQSTAASRPVLSARYNLLTATERFDDAVWTKTGVTVTANAAVAPDGTTTADKVVSDASSGFHRVNVSSQSLAAANHTFSAYMKAAEYTSGALSLFNGTSFVARATFNLSAGTVGITDGEATISDAGNGWYRCTVTGLGNATITPYISVNSAFTFAGTSGSGILIWGADLRVTNDGMNLPVYQRVNTSTDYDTVGFPPYLRFDGSDDFLVTNTITPGIDKVQVFAGVRKLSDAAFQSISEFGPSADVNTGSFCFGASAATFDPTRRNWSLVLAGSTAGLVTSALGYPAPDTRVVAGIFDLSQSTHALEAIMRINGAMATVSQSASSAGTGNFNAYQMFIGRRNGTSNPFNGRLYSLIVRFGANLTADQITQAETWVNGKTKGY